MLRKEGQSHRLKRLEKDMPGHRGRLLDRLEAPLPGADCRYPFVCVSP